MPQFKYHVPTSFLIPLTASILFVILSIRLNASQILGNSTLKWRQTLQYTQNAICHWPHPPALSALPFLSGWLPACSTDCRTGRNGHEPIYLCHVGCFAAFVCVCVCSRESLCVCESVFVCVCAWVCVRELTNVQADACRRWRRSKGARKI